MIIFKIRIFKLSDIDQGTHKPVRKKKQLGVSSLFEKMLSRETEKNPTFVYPGLCYADKNFFWKVFL